MLVGILFAWSGVVVYHVNVHEGVGTLPQRAIGYCSGDVSETSFILCLIGLGLWAVCLGFFLVIDSDNLKSNLGMTMGVVTGMSAWYLFGIEGRAALLLPEEKHLWAPLMSHLVLTVLSLIVFIRNFNAEDKFVLFLGIMGSVFSQTFLTAMIFINYNFGLALLCSAPVFIISAYCVAQFSTSQDASAAEIEPLCTP